MGRGGDGKGGGWRRMAGGGGERVWASSSKEFVGRECGPLSSVVWASLVVTSLSCQYSLYVYSWPCFSFLLAFAGFVVVVLFGWLVLGLLFLLLLLVCACVSSSFFFLFSFSSLCFVNHEPVSYASSCCC